MDKKIVFILTSTVNPNSIKRIDEFVARGYNVRAYGFKRDVDVPNKSKTIDIEVLGSFKNDLSYYKRCPLIYGGIRRVLRETKGLDCIYYLVGLDVAMLFRLQSQRPYMFEEADLVHTNNKNSFIKNCYERIDKAIIRHSLLSAFRSEGFVRYHFGDVVPENVHVIANRLNVGILNFATLPKATPDLAHLKIGFVGFIRYKSILNFAKVFCTRFPQHEFHFYGTFSADGIRRQYEELESLPNCHFHGSFKSPDELNKIYSQIDLVLSTYDVSSENVRSAEPNKIYEAIYFDTPIIVSSNTFLADKVCRLGIGYDIDAMDKQSIVDFVHHIMKNGVDRKVKAIRSIDKQSVINRNDEFFKKVQKKMDEKRLKQVYDFNQLRDNELIGGVICKLPPVDNVVALFQNVGRRAA